MHPGEVFDLWYSGEWVGTCVLSPGKQLLVVELA